MCPVCRALGAGVGIITSKAEGKTLYSKGDILRDGGVEALAVDNVKMGEVVLRRELD